MLTLSFARFSIGFLCGCWCSWCGGRCGGGCCGLGAFWTFSSDIQHLSPGPISRAICAITHLLQKSIEQGGYINHWHFDRRLLIVDGRRIARQRREDGTGDVDDCDSVVIRMLIGTTVATLPPFWDGGKVVNFGFHQRLCVCGFSFKNFVFAPKISPVFITVFNSISLFLFCFCVLFECIIYELPSSAHDQPAVRALNHITTNCVFMSQ